MSRRGVIVLSVLFGLFAISFGVFGLRALALGPDAPEVTPSEIQRREAAADRTAASIKRMRADMPPALPADAGATVPPSAVGAAQYGDDETASGEEYEDRDDGDGWGEREGSDDHEAGDHDDDDHHDDHDDDGHPGAWSGDDD